MSLTSPPLESYNVESGDPTVVGGTVSSPREQMLVNAGTDLRVQYFVHYVLGPPRYSDLSFQFCSNLMAH